MIAPVRIPTEEENRKRNERERLFDYYGIPHGVFDEFDIPRHIERDWHKAILLILNDEEIPKDLEERLLKYKAEHQGNRKRGRD